MSSAAALQLRPQPRLQPTTPPPGRGAPARPHLRVLEGGQAPARQAQAAAYRRRRVVALLVVAAVVAALVFLASAVLAGNAGGGTPSSAAGTSASGAVHVVQPGDTLWSIARDLDLGGDVRLTVDRLAELNGGAPLAVGQRLLLP
jgi:nucleoid-associated protein YgaU